MEPCDAFEYEANPLGMTTAEIASVTIWIEHRMAWHIERGNTRIVTQCRARLAALRAELIRRTN